MILTLTAILLFVTIQSLLYAYRCNVETKTLHDQNIRQATLLTMYGRQNNELSEQLHALGALQPYRSSTEQMIAEANEAVGSEVVVTDIVVAPGPEPFAITKMRALERGIKGLVNHFWPS